MDLMAGMGWNKATDFLLTAWKEPFYGWYDDPGATPRFALFLVAVVAPVGLGAAAGLRRVPRVMAPLLAFAVLSVGAIVGFGISKARYVYPSQWILLLLWAWGALCAAALGLRTLGPRLPAAAAGGAAVLAAAGGVALQADALGPFLAEPRVTPLALELGFGAVLLAILAVGLFDVFARRGRLGLAAGLAVLALAGPIVTGSLQRKIRIQTKSYYGNYSAVVASRWLAANLAPGERALTQHASQIRFLGELPRDRVASYSGMDAADLPALRAEMRQRGLTHALYTWRKPVQTPSDAYYYRRLRSDLAELFKDGGPVEGFAHVATLPLPDALERDPVQVYRLLPPGPGSSGR
jgi:hypothetical protein